jgi:NAD(P)-dependent dehydrogenase (short-subunit alcohol dehydrogenase family)
MANRDYSKTLVRPLPVHRWRQRRFRDAGMTELWHWWLGRAPCRLHAAVQISARQVGIPRESFTYLQCDLASLESVREFISNFKASGVPLDALVCNAAVYLPVDKEPSFSVEGYELSVAVNHLGHFLLANELLPLLEKSQHKRYAPVTLSLAGCLSPSLAVFCLHERAAVCFITCSAQCATDGSAWLQDDHCGVHHRKQEHSRRKHPPPG